ncbi:MAG: hypothetical protein Q9227_007342 [Pyrenula ochraceoflavens]
MMESQWVIRSLLSRRSRQYLCSHCRHAKRHASTSTQVSTPDPLQDVVTESSFTAFPPSSEETPAFDPLALSRSRKKKLPASRYQFRPPKYDRGPLHPIQPPPPSDPSSREFTPGPFSSPRLEQTYNSIISPDILTMCYVHNPPGFRPPSKGPRLRTWDDSSPYHKGRPLRAPRGGDVLRLLRKPITFQNIPAIRRITVHSYVKGVVRSGSQFLHVAGMVLQSITNMRAVPHKTRTSVTEWGIIAGKTTPAVTVDLQGENMYHFLSKLVDVVMPRIKDWMGVRATTGDGSGNLTFGLEPELVSLFPEVEMNYDK